MARQTKAQLEYNEFWMALPIEEKREFREEQEKYDALSEEEKDKLEQEEMEGCFELERRFKAGDPELIEEAEKIRERTDQFNLERKLLLDEMNLFLDNMDKLKALTNKPTRSSRVQEWLRLVEEGQHGQDGPISDEEADLLISEGDLLQDKLNKLCAEMTTGEWAELLEEINPPTNKPTK